MLLTDLNNKEREKRMFANTKQVRVVANAIIGHSARTTDRTDKLTRLGKNANRRSVTWFLPPYPDPDDIADRILEKFKLLGYTNRVKVTGGGGLNALPGRYYLRIVAELA